MMWMVAVVVKAISGKEVYFFFLGSTAFECVYFQSRYAYQLFDNVILEYVCN